MLNGSSDYTRSEPAHPSLQGTAWAHLQQPRRREAEEPVARQNHVIVQWQVEQSAGLDQLFGD